MLFRSPSERQLDIALVLLRAVVGIIFAAHGAQKLFVFGLDNLAAGFGQIGVPMPAVTGLLVALMELVGGALLVAGALTRLVALGLAITMLGATFLVHFSAGFFLPNGYEFTFALFGASVFFLLTGAGRLSADALIARRTHRV